MRISLVRTEDVVVPSPAKIFVAPDYFLRSFDPIS
jgi:hypothetical protein